MPPRNPVLQPVLLEQLRRLPVVLLGELDDGRLPRSGLEQLDLDRADAAAHLEHGRVGDAALGQAIDDRARGLVEPLPAIAACVAPRQALAEDLAVPGSTTGAHDAGRHRRPLRPI